MQRRAILINLINWGLILFEPATGMLNLIYQCLDIHICNSFIAIWFINSKLAKHMGLISLAQFFLYPSFLTF